MTKKDLFLELAQPDKDGFSRVVLASEFADKYASLKLGNGGSWCRRESSLAQHYNVERIKGEKGNQIIAVKLNGFKKNPIQRKIAAHIRAVISKKRCVVLDISTSIEVDHKDGRLDDSRVFDIEKQELADFQALSRSVNMAKRQHCKRCKETGFRYNAENLGYSKSVFVGELEYKGSCVGCYWHDPKRFNSEISTV